MKNNCGLEAFNELLQKRLRVDGRTSFLIEVEGMCADDRFVVALEWWS